MPESTDDFAAGFRGASQQSEDTSTAKGDASTTDKPAQSAPAGAADAAPESEAAGGDEAEGAAADKASDDKPKAEEPDPLAAIRKELAEAQHRERSSASRVSAFMKENNQLKERLGAIERQLKEAAAKPPATKRADDAELDDVLAGAPDLRSAVERRIERATAELRKQVEELGGKLTEVDKAASKAAADLQPLRERDEQAELGRVFGELDKQLPGWREQVKSPEFKSWLEGQPSEIQALYENGRTVAQASTVIKLYRTDTGASGKPAEKPAGTDEAAAKAARLKEAAGIRSKATTPKADDRDSFAAGFRMQTTT